MFAVFSTPTAVPVMHSWRGLGTRQTPPSKSQHSCCVCAHFPPKNLLGFATAPGEQIGLSMNSWGTLLVAVPQPFQHSHFSAHHYPVRASQVSHSLIFLFQSQKIIPIAYKSQGMN